MESIAVSIDLAKEVLSVCGVSAHGRVVLKDGLRPWTTRQGRRKSVEKQGPGEAGPGFNPGGLTGNLLWSG